MELQFVTFEQAQALYELGFPQETEELYAVCDYCCDDSDDYITYNKGDLIEGYCGRFAAKDVISAPSLELAAKWFREEKLIHIFITHLNADTNWWEYNIETINGNFVEHGKMYKSYDEALSAGIDSIIKLLKKD